MLFRRSLQIGTVCCWLVVVLVVVTRVAGLALLGWIMFGLSVLLFVFSLWLERKVGGSKYRGGNR
jgi:hypothetical protein